MLLFYVGLFYFSTLINEIIISDYEFLIRSQKLEDEAIHNYTTFGLFYFGVLNIIAKEDQDGM